MTTFKKLRIAIVLTMTMVETALAQAPKKIESQTSFGSLQGIVTAIFQALYLFLPAVATLYLILTGYRYIVAQGNPDLVEKAKKSLTYAVFGVIIAYSAAVIILTFAKPLGFNPGF